MPPPTKDALQSTPLKTNHNLNPYNHAHTTTHLLISIGARESERRREGGGERAGLTSSRSEEVNQESAVGGTIAFESKRGRKLLFMSKSSSETSENAERDF